MEQDAEEGSGKNTFTLCRCWNFGCGGKVVDYTHFTTTVSAVLPLIVPWHYGWVKVTGGLGGGGGCFVKCKVSGLFIKRKD